MGTMARVATYRSLHRKQLISLKLEKPDLAAQRALWERAACEEIRGRHAALGRSARRV